MVSCTCYHVVSQRFTRGIQCLASVFMQFHKYSPEGFNVVHLLSCNITNIHQEDILSCICQRVLPQRFSWVIYCLASVRVQFHNDSPEGYSVLHLLSCIITKILLGDILSRICYRVVSQRLTRGMQCVASVIIQFHKDSPEGYCVLHLLACSFTNILQREIVSCICYHVVSHRFIRGIQCLASVIMQFREDSPEEYSGSHLLSCSFAKIHQRNIVSCICSHVITQMFTRGIQCLAPVTMQFHKDSPKGYSVLHLLSCSFAKIIQRDIVSCICYRVVSQRFSRGIQCLVSVIMQFREDSPEEYSGSHLLSCSFAKIHQRDIVSCICYHVVSQRFIRGIQCLASVSMQFHKYSPEGCSVLHLLSFGFTKIHQRDIVSSICYHVLSQIFTRGIQCLASVIMQFHKGSPEKYSVLHLFSCSFTMIHQRDIVSCICYHELSQRFSWGIYCLASVIMQFHKDSPEGYCVLHLLACSFTKIHQRDVVSCICYHVVSQRIHQRDIVSCICYHVVSQIFTRGIQCLAPVIM